MDGGPFEEALFDPSPFSGFVIEPLKEDRQILYQKYTAKDRDQQLFVNDDGEYCYDTANGEAARISHEYLCRIGVVPKETDERTDESTNVNYQFFRSGDVHDVQVLRKLHVAGHVCQYSQGQSDDGGVPRCHAVHTVIQVCSVRYSGNNEDGDNDKQYPSCRLGMFAHEAYKVGIVKVITFKERDGGLGGFQIVRTVNHLHLFSGLQHFDVFADHDIRAQIESQPYDQSQSHLTDDLEFTVETFLVFFEYLDIIV